jgi:hypothetical protein
MANIAAEIRTETHQKKDNIYSALQLRYPARDEG